MWGSPPWPNRHLLSSIHTPTSDSVHGMHGQGQGSRSRESRKLAGDTEQDFLDICSCYFHLARAEKWVSGPILFNKKLGFMLFFFFPPPAFPDPFTLPWVLSVPLLVRTIPRTAPIPLVASLLCPGYSWVLAATEIQCRRGSIWFIHLSFCPEQRI